MYNRILVIKKIPLLSMALMAVSGGLHTGKKEVCQLLYKAEQRSLGKIIFHVLCGQ